jgi:hypothetical protein
MSLRRLLVGHALFAVAAASAGVIGCSSDTPASATVFLTTTVGTSLDYGTAACGVTEADWITIGDTSNPKHDGEDQNGLTVQVSCSVTSNPDGSFNVSARGSLGSRGSLVIGGKFTPGLQDTQQGIRGVFQRGDFGAFTDANCTVTYTGSSKVGVAGGRVAGHIDCRAAQDPTQQRMDLMGKPIPRTCEGQGDFRFENCSQ